MNTFYCFVCSILLSLSLYVFSPLPACSQDFLQYGGFTVTAQADPDSICQGTSSQLDVTIIGGTSPFTYQWTPEAYLTDPTISNPVASPDASGWFYVTVTDNTLQSESDSIFVTVLNAPPSPGPISGATLVCHDSTEVYQVSSMPGALSYSWTVPAGAVILSGQNSPTITVLWGDTTGVVSVIIGNECGNSPPSAIPVTVLLPLPVPGPVLGPELGCTGIESYFEITPMAEADTYAWSVPQDAVIVSGQGTNSITVEWGSISGDILVVAQNACGDSPPKSRYLIATPLPGPAGSITGKDTVCLNHSGYLYTVPVISGAASYNWSLPQGATISQGTGTHQVMIDFGPDAISGEMMVSGSNGCGTGAFSTKTIMVMNCSGVPRFSLRSRVNLFPNPVSRVLTIQISGEETTVDLIILDVMGNALYAKTDINVDHQTIEKVDISDIPDGIYIVRISQEDRYHCEKLVVRK